MKKFLGAIIFVLMLFMFTGCIRFNTTIEVKKNGKADVSMIYAAYDSGDGSSSSDDEEDINKLKAEGWEVETYNEDGYKGYKCIKKNVDFVDLSKGLGGDENNEAGIDYDSLSVKKNGMTYVFDWDIMGSSDDSEDADDAETDQYKDYIKQYNGYLTFVLKLPFKPKASNATEVSEDGKTLTWDLLEMKKGDKIHVEFSLINLPLIIGCVVAVIVIIAVVVILLVVLQKKNAPAGGPTGGAGPGGYYGGQGFDQNQYGGQQQYYADPNAQYQQQGYADPNAQQYDPNAYAQQSQQQYYADPNAQYQQQGYADPNAQQYDPNAYAQQGYAQQPQDPNQPQ